MAVVSSPKTPDITLYTGQTPNGIKISMTLEELGLPYKTHAIDISKDTQKEPWFLAINPNGRIPALTDTFTDGRTIRLFESGSIMQYLVEQYDTEHKISYPKGSRQSYDVNNWLFFLNAGVGPMQGQANHFFRYAPEKIQYGINRYQNETRRLYGVLDKHLKEAGTEYIVGDKCTIADIAHWGWITAAGWAGVEIDEFPTLKDWEERMLKRPAVEKGRHVPTRHNLKEVLKDKEETERLAKVASEWVQRGQKEAAKRGYHASVAVGDFVYIDGEEVTELQSADEDAIDHIFLCWQFTADGRGGGSWDIFKTDDNSNFTGLTRPDDAVGATVDNTGFIFKGHESARSSPETAFLPSNVPIPGIVSFNIISSRWSNDTLPNYIQQADGPQGIFASVPIAGLNGLLIMSGLTRDASNPPSLDNITIYDASSKSWHAQTATGQIPSGRGNACTVGVKGDNGTFEVFMYGGLNVLGLNGNLTLTQYKANIALDEVYVLSLPAFAWFKADYPAKHPRLRHTCHLVGNRQLPSIGGHDPTDVYHNALSTDPFTQGLGIFDLTEMQWSNRYDADAKPYETPAVVKAWYSANGTPTKTWDDPAVQELFRKVSPTTSTLTTSSNPSSASSLPKSHSPSGAIAGGVLGSFTALCLLSVLVLWCLRRRRRRRRRQVSCRSGSVGYSAPGDQMLEVRVSESQRQATCSELPAKKWHPQELPPDDYRSLPEMDGAPSREELDGGGRDLNGRRKSLLHTAKAVPDP